jgi:hypothetical protein
MSERSLGRLVRVTVPRGVWVRLAYARCSVIGATAAAGATATDGAVVAAHAVNSGASIVRMARASARSRLTAIPP